MDVLYPRESAEFIASIAEDVKINQDGVKSVARQVSEAIKNKEFVPSQMMLHEYPLPLAADESSIDWMFVADTLNFSFWGQDEGQHYAVELHGKQYTGYMALCAALTRAVEAGIPITSPKFYASITEKDVKEIFASSSSSEIPLIEHRVRNLHESGRILNEKFGGSFANCIRQCNQSALQLLKLITTEFTSFRDEGLIQGKRVSFYKRAQILVGDIWGLFRGDGLGKFHDIDSLTMFADYRVPQSLVHFGALEYSDQLYELLNKNHMFQNGDREEMEIRGCSIHAVELIRQELKHFEMPLDDEALQVNSTMIDFFLWEYRRRFAADLARIPYHKVRCIYY